MSLHHKQGEHLHRGWGAPPFGVTERKQMGFESQIIEGNEFLLNSIDAPVRAVPKAHQCVCLLMHGTPADVEHGLGRQDKCQQMIDNPDQPFCDDCEDNEHHLAPNQLGEARNIHRKNKGND